MMKSITNFDVVLMPFPFTDLSSAKKRPCLVLKVFEATGKIPPLAIFAMMTSQTEINSFEGDCAVSDLKTAGLPKETTIRLAKVFTGEATLALKKLGTLSLKDQSIVKKSWQKIFNY